MSNLAIPIPKTAGGRPPFSGPPSRTTFDSRPDDSGEPIHKRIRDSVMQVITACKDADGELVPVLLRMIAQRKQMVEKELTMLRLMEDEPLPPLLANFYVVDLNDDSEIERLYVRLLDDLETAANNIRNIVGRQIG